MSTDLDAGEPESCDGLLFQPERFGDLLDPDAGTDVDLFLEVPADAGLEDLGGALKAVLSDDPGAERVALVVGGKAIGTTSRSRLEHIGVYDPESGRPESAGMTLPGGPRYRALRYACPTAGCAATTYRIHHDEEHPPVCPQHVAPMDLVP